MLDRELGHVLEDELLQAVAPDPSDRIVLLADAEREQLEEPVQHVLKGVKVMREEGDHVAEGLDHGGG